MVLNNNKYDINFLNWDTEMFGIKSSKITLKQEISQQEMKEIIDYINDEEYKFITIENKNNNIKNNILISKLNSAFLADVNIQFCKEKLNPINCFEDITIENNYKFNDDIIEISKRAYIHSRFINDEQLNENKYNVYTQWVKNSFEKENKYFCHTEDNGITVGYILFSIANEEIIIELIAIDKNAKGKGIGTKLINATEKFASEKEIKKIKVGTQLNNIAAQNFYIKNGFKHVQNNSIYHWWI